MSAPTLPLPGLGGRSGGAGRAAGSGGLSDGPAPLGADGDVRVLVTGWRYWPELFAFVVYQALDAAFWQSMAVPAARRFVVVHGACPQGGVDAFAQRWADRNAFAVSEPHPGRWVGRRFLGPERNQEMVNAGARLCLAFPGPGSRGTLDCLGRAIAADIPVEVVAWSSAAAREWAVDGDLDAGWETVLLSTKRAR